MKKLLERSGVMAEQVEAEHKARREYIERNYKLTSRGFDEIGIPEKAATSAATDKIIYERK